MRLLEVMASSRIVMALVAAASSVALTVACSSSSTGGEGTSGTFDPNHPVTKCNSTVIPALRSTCKDGDLDAYKACVQVKCESQYKKCLGDNFRSSPLVGVCGAYLTCTNACGCTDTDCRLKCTLDGECLKCFVNDFEACKKGCTLPSCASGG